MSSDDALQIRVRTNNSRKVNPNMFDPSLISPRNIEIDILEYDNYNKGDQHDSFEHVNHAANIDNIDKVKSSTNSVTISEKYNIPSIQIPIRSLNKQLVSWQLDPEKNNIDYSPRNSIRDSENIEITNTLNEQPSNFSVLTDIIQNEENLIDYTENHFNNIIINDLNKIRLQTKDDKYNNDNNSPIMSINGSVTDGDDDNDLAYHSDDDYGGHDDNEYQHKKKNVTMEIQNTDGNNFNRRRDLRKFKRFSSAEIQGSLNKYYVNNEFDNKYSTEIDILSTYVKGQQNLYIHSKQYSENNLNILTISSLTLTCVITVISPFYCTYEWNSILITTMNAIVVLFISLMNYLKLESSTEKYLQVANHYDKIETSLELANSKIIFLKNEQEQSDMVLDIIKNLEKKIIEIKNKHVILIPNIIQNLFPCICNINIFIFIKKTEMYKNKLINHLKDIKNEISYILYKWKKHGVNIQNINDVIMLDESDQTPKIQKERSRLIYLYKVKDGFLKEILELRCIYGLLEDLFNKEIKRAEISIFYFICYFLFHKKIIFSKKYLKDSNPIILKHLLSIGIIYDDGHE